MCVMYVCVSFPLFFFSKVISHVPQLMLWDDHEVRNDWGTFPEDHVVDSVNWKVGKAARQAYWGMYMHAYIHTYVHTYIHTYVHTYIHTYIRSYIHAYIHIYIHIYTYIHT